MTEIPGNLKAAMEAYISTAADMNLNPVVIECRLKVENAMRALEVAQSTLNDAEQSYRDRMREKEDYIIAQVLELGTSIAHYGVTAKHRNGYERVTWDNKKMTSICMANPALLDLLAPARKVTDVAPSVKISYEPVAELT